MQSQEPSCFINHITALRLWLAEGFYDKSWDSNSLFLIPEKLDADISAPISMSLEI